MFGKAISCLAAICGLLIFSLPLAIITKNFDGYYENKTKMEMKSQKKEIQRILHNNKK